MVAEVTEKVTSWVIVVHPPLAVFLWRRQIQDIKDFPMDSLSMGQME